MFEICLDILAEVESGTLLPTRIMYGANMSQNPFKMTLMRLTAQGFIEEQSIDGGKRSKKIYAFTGRGDNVKCLREVKEMPEPEKMVEIRV